MIHNCEQAYMIHTQEKTPKRNGLKWQFANMGQVQGFPFWYFKIAYLNPWLAY